MEILFDQIIVYTMVELSSSMSLRYETDWSAWYYIWWAYVKHFIVVSYTKHT